VIHIVYGYPSPEAQKKAEQGKIKLGGCVVTGDDPEWFCCECEEKF